MTATNPHPLANPLNRHMYADYEIMHMPNAISKCTDPSKLQVPDSTMTYEQAIEAQRSLTVPYSHSDSIAPHASTGFIGDSSLFKLHDGSIIDLKAHKIVFDPSINFKDAGYWNDPASNVSIDGLGEWGKTEDVASILAQYEASGCSYDPNMSPESIKYWRHAQEESKKLVQNMTEEQKKLLDDLNAEQFFPLSRLKEEPCH